jgi:hypothetical protein
MSEFKLGINMKKTINRALAGTGGIGNSFVRGLKAANGANILAAASRRKIWKN